MCFASSGLKQTRMDFLVHPKRSSCCIAYPVFSVASNSKFLAHTGSMRIGVVVRLVLFIASDICLIFIVAVISSITFVSLCCYLIC